MRFAFAPPVPKVTISLVAKPVVAGLEAEACWAFYDRAFEKLRAQAAQRHAMTRSEFEDQMGDPRVIKHIVYNDADSSKPAGMMTLTNDLAAVPLISPEFYQARWPLHYAQQDIWYVGFLAIDPDYHGTGVLAQMIAAMCAVIPSHGGVIATDICQFNQEGTLRPAMFNRLAGTFARQPEQQRLDTQVFWGYEFASAA
jgi:hypothetical protein